MSKTLSLPPRSYSLRSTLTLKKKRPLHDPEMNAGGVSTGPQENRGAWNGNPRDNLVPFLLGADISSMNFGSGGERIGK